MPASDVHGEGIFIVRFEGERDPLESLGSVQNRDELKDRASWLAERPGMLHPEKGYPGIRYAMLHTVADPPIRRSLWLECATTRPVSANGFTPMPCGRPMARRALDGGGRLGWHTWRLGRIG